MIKKMIITAASAATIFGAAAVLPQAGFLMGSDIPAAAAVSGDYEYKALSDGTVKITEYKGKASNLTVPDKLNGKTVSAIGDQAFYQCDLKTVTIPKSVKTLGADSFRESASLTKVTFSGGTTSIGTYSFYGCTSLKTVTLGSGLKDIGTYVFYNCKELTSIKIPDTVTSIGEYCFENCSNLKTATLPAEITEIKDDTFAWCTSLESIRIPNKVKKIGWRAFSSCKEMKSVIMPNSLKTLAEDAFNRCTNLTSISIPNSVTSIGKGAFENCTGLTGVVIPSTVKEIGSYAFGFLHSTGSATHTRISGFTVYGSTYIAEYYAKYDGHKYVDNRMSKCSASIPYSSYTYRGRGIKPTVTVKDSAGNKLKSGTDYSVAYSGNTNAGTATITVTGKGIFTDTLKKKFTVKALDLSSSYAKVSIPYSSYTYTGSAIKPKVTVKFKDGDVIPTGDYTLSYSANTKVGTATITVKGKGSNVTGTYKKTFIVKPAKNEITSISSTKGAFKVNWKKGTAGTVGYQVQYSTDKNFKNNVHSYTSTALSDLSENFSKVPNSGETWYVRVRSFYTKDGKTTSTRYGNYSAVKSIKIK